MWPWSEIAKWKQLAQHYEGLAHQHGHRAELFRAEYLQLRREVLGAHKGIWRLRQKLTRYQKEEP
jgi:hypothetical protein